VAKLDDKELAVVAQALPKVTRLDERRPR